MTKKLTEEQKKIVQFYGAPLRVLAGPGTGKTMCLVEKVKFLIKDKRIPYSEISLVTFTKAAASELRERIFKSGIDSDKLPYVSTLHGLAMNILKKNFDKSGLKEGFQPISNNLTNILTKDVVYELKSKGINLPYEEIRIYKDFHFKQKARAKLPDNILLDRKKMELLSLFSSTFHDQLAFYNSLDWTDILIKTIDLINKDPDIRKKIHTSTKHFLVDEYQDLSPLEQEFVEKVSADELGLCVVGDDDQSIYETFRFAEPKGLINFIKKYPKGKNLDMTICWRCPPRVIEVALMLIKNNKIREHSKTLKPANEEKKGFVVCLSHKSKKAEIKWLIEKIVHIKSKGYKYEDIMVLFTDGKIAKDYIIEMKKNNIPLDIKLKVASIFESDIFIACFTSFKLLVNPSDNLNIRYCLHSWKGIGPETVRQIRLLSVSLKIDLWNTIKKISENVATFKDIRYRNKVKDFYNFYNFLSGRTEFKDLINNYVSKFPESKADKGCNILFETFKKYSNEENMITLKEIIEDFDQKIESGDLEDKYKEKEEGVKIMTMHSAKGCQSPIVIIPALEDDIIPGLAENIEEKRRLFYVSITRAKVGVYLSWAYQRSGQEIHMVKGRKMLSKSRSRFLDEVKELI